MNKQKRVLFITNYPSPYRVQFFNELGKHCNLTVTFEESPQQQKHTSHKLRKILSKVSTITLLSADIQHHQA